MAAQKFLGELLVEMRFIDERQLAVALAEQKQSGLRLGRILVQMGLLTEERLTRALSRQLGVEVCSPLQAPIHPKVLAMVPGELALVYHVLPIALKREEAGQTLVVATADPLDRAALEALRMHLGQAVRVRWLIAGETEVDLALSRHYSLEPPRLAGHTASHFPPPDPSNGSRPAVITGVPVSGPKNPALYRGDSGDLRRMDTGDLRRSDSGDLRRTETGDLRRTDGSVEPRRAWAPPPDPPGPPPVAPAAFGEPLPTSRSQPDEGVIEDAVLIEEPPEQESQPLEVLSPSSDLEAELSLALQAAPEPEPEPRRSASSPSVSAALSESWGDLVLSPAGAGVSLEQLEPLAETLLPAAAGVEEAIELEIEEAPPSAPPAPDPWGAALDQALEHASRDLPPPEVPSPGSDWSGVEAAAEELPDASSDISLAEGSGSYDLTSELRGEPVVPALAAAPRLVLDQDLATRPTPEEDLRREAPRGAGDARLVNAADLAPPRPTADQVRRALVAFLQDEPLDPRLERFLLRTMAAMFLQEGFLDGDRLERALTKVR